MRKTLQKLMIPCGFAFTKIMQGESRTKQSSLFFVTNIRLSRIYSAFIARASTKDSRLFHLKCSDGVLLNTGAAKPSNYVLTGGDAASRSGQGTVGTTASTQPGASERSN